ncbi:hypothetical protein LWI28_001161 [Acer negundo]|uniref:Uncharacterized protein n=1 Tax=Acer negundo TaxID=4023 RepID=A0AAD5P3M2_ACENE|nr:hypothetical protein LWI28_001161 [Acer negundo]
MYARDKLVPTTAERAEWYFEGIYEGDSQYEVDAAYVPDHVEDLDRHTTTEPSDTEGQSSGCSDIECSDPEGGNGRHRRVRFSLPIREGVGGHPQVLPQELTVDRSSQPLHDHVHFPNLTPHGESQLLRDPVHFQDLTPHRSSQRIPPPPSVDPPVDPNSANPFR